MRLGVFFYFMRQSNAGYFAGGVYLLSMQRKPGCRKLLHHRSPLVWCAV